MIIRDGLHTLFWEDRWLDGESISDIAPCLYSLVPVLTQRRQMVSQALHERTWARSFSRGMSTQAILDYLHLWHLLASI